MTANYGQGKAGRLRERAHALLHEHRAAGELPTSIRFLFYELVQRAVVNKAQGSGGGRTAAQDLADAVMWLRERELVPWEWIVDETRTLSAWRYAETVADYVAASVDTARVNCWGTDEPPLLICESRTFGGILARTLAPAYLCPVTATNGQAGGFLHTEVAPLLRGNERRVLYIGDHDPQGADIEANTRAVLDAEARREITWERIALTPEQAAGLPTITKTDRRYKPPRHYEAVEVEALGQGAVTSLVEEALSALLPQPLEAVREREAAEREAVAAVLRR